jgi:alkylation response protein AidB-like acyl-CoA dehydrogenase
MSVSKPATAERASDAERAMLRKSVRDFLSRRWPAATAVENANDAEAITALWREMAGQGLAELGSGSSETGAREILVVFEELGRAACPAPLLGAIAANLTLTNRAEAAARALLNDLHQGKAAVAAALGTFDGDAAAGTVEWRGDALSGTISFVEGAPSATHVLVFTDAGAAIVQTGATGLRIEATPGLPVPSFSALTFDNTPASRVAVSTAALADVAQIMRLACAGRALGAAQRGFDLSVEHAKVRKQFGQLIGQFQAVQHKLANNLISLDGARLALDSAADARDRGDADWSVFAAAALAFAGPALREVAVQTHRALGAIGYAEEHEAPRHFRRVHADLVRLGGVARARAALADHLLGPAG